MYVVLGLLRSCCFMTPDLLLFESEFNFAKHRLGRQVRSWEAVCGFSSTGNLFIRLQCLHQAEVICEPVKKKEDFKIII